MLPGGQHIQLVTNKASELHIKNTLTYPGEFLEKSHPIPSPNPLLEGAPVTREKSHTIPCPNPLLNGAPVTHEKSRTIPCPNPPLDGALVIHEKSPHPMSKPAARWRPSHP